MFSSFTQTIANSEAPRGNFCLNVHVQGSPHMQAHASSMQVAQYNPILGNPMYVCIMGSERVHMGSVFAGRMMIETSLRGTTERGPPRPLADYDGC